MGRHNTEEIKKYSHNRSKSLQGAVQVLDKKKREAIAAATEKPGLCGLILIALLLGIVAFPATGMIVLLA